MDIERIDLNLVNWYSRYFRINEVFKELNFDEEAKVFDSQTFVILFKSSCEVILVEKKDVSKKIELLTFDSAYELVSKGLINKSEFKELICVIVNSNFMAGFDKRFDLSKEDDSFVIDLLNKSLDSDYE